MAPSDLRNNLQSEPSLPAKLTDDRPASETLKNLTPTAFYAIKLLGYARIGLGAASLFAPRFTCGLFNFPISSETATVVRMFGTRGVALGQILITADDKAHVDGGTTELTRVLLANMACDVVDIFSLAFAIASGHISGEPGRLLAGGAAFLVGVGMLGLKTV